MEAADLGLRGRRLGEDRSRVHSSLLLGWELEVHPGWNWGAWLQSSLLLVEAVGWHRYWWGCGMVSLVRWDPAVSLCLVSISKAT